MRQKLFNLYNRCKSSFVEEMIEAIKAQGTKITFTPYISISLPRDNDEFLEEIVEIEFDVSTNIWYAHNFITEVDLMINEYWTPLIDLSFDELFKIAEKI